MPLRRMDLPSDFIKMLSAAYGSEKADEIIAGYSQEIPVSIRLNPKKVPSDSDIENILDVCKKGYKPVEHCREGLFLDNRPVFTSDPSFQSGCYYVQEASSMYIGKAMKYVESKSSLKLLDLCAAPGGKSTHWISLLQDFPDSTIVANEVINSRAKILCENMSKWGAANVVVTNNDPSAFGKMEGYFDILAVDAPCSGEGMFRKDEGAIMDWSLDNVEFCASRQWRIVSDAWPSLKKGGLLVYSTCTLNEKEDEGNVKRIVEELGGELLEDRKFFPGEPGSGEGFYCAFIRKTSSSDEKAGHSKKIKKVNSPADSSLLEKIEGNVRLERKGNLVKAYPAALYDDIKYIESQTRVLMSGIAIATVKEGNNRIYIPEHDFIQSELYKRGAFAEKEIDAGTSLKYMRKENISLNDAPKGYIVLLYHDIPLGLVKNLPNRVNNLWPNSRRILSV